MADPSGSASRMGFPLAYGSTPYQHQQQFQQFQPAPVSSATPQFPQPTHNGYPTPAPFPSNNGYAANQYQTQGAPMPGPPQPTMSTGSIGTFPGSSSTTPVPHTTRAYTPQSQAFPAPQQVPNTQQTAFKPYTESAPLLPPSLPQQSNNPMPNGYGQAPSAFPTPVASMPSGTTANVPRPIPVQAYPGTMPATPAFQPTTAVPSTGYGYQPPPAPAQPERSMANGPMYAGPPPMPGFPQRPVAAAAPQVQPSSSYGQTPGGFPQQGAGQQQMNAMTQQFANTNIGSGGAPGGQSQWGYGPGHGGSSDAIDLLSERNIIMGGFDDIQYRLPQNLANSETRVDPGVFRSTLNMIPQTEELLKKSRLPFGLTLHPFKDMKNLNIIQTSTIVRCRYCRTYINPYVTIPDARHWKCNLCNRNNDLPDDFCWDPQTKSFGDPASRPEIKFATVEFIAPSEYMLRTPQPAVYVFVLDVSSDAVESGYLHTFAEQMLINIDQLPGDERTQVAFVGVDSALHFFQFSSSGRLPRQLIVDDIEEIFLPSNQGILVPLKKNKEVIRSFVQQLPTIFGVARTKSNCLGAALNVLHELIADIGGRITVFQASLPDSGPGALQPREDPNQRAATDVQNLGPATDFYKRLSLECTGHQVSLDLFVLNTSYADIATLSEMAKFSTGCVYHFPNYSWSNNYIQTRKFEKVLQRYFTRKIGFEAVLRIRCSRGLALSAFFGNFFVRSTDLLALANVNPDSAIAVQVNMEEKLGSSVCFQAALLYTSSKGDRRIRVHTMCLPTTADLAQVYSNFDLKASVSLLAKLGVDRSMTGAPLADCREALVNAAMDSLGAYQRTIGQGRNGLLAPRQGHLRLFPLYVLALLKHTAFCAGRSVKVDDRVAAMLLLRHCPLEQILSDVYPQLYRLDTLIHSEEEPRPLPLSFEHISRDGIYLMEAGTCAFLYVSNAVDQNVLQQLFGTANYQQINDESFREYENQASQRVQAFVKSVVSLKFFVGPISVIREDSPLREQFVLRMVDDRSESTHSYVEFLQHIKREIRN